MEMETSVELAAVISNEPEIERDGRASIATTALTTTLERLAAVAGSLEKAIERLFEREGEFALSAESGVGRIVATVASPREAELEEKLATAEAEIAALKASVEVPAPVTYGRKTLPVSMVSLLAKQGLAVDSDSIEASTLDAALSSLSIEQRIAVKSQLMRAGLVG